MKLRTVLSILLSLSQLGTAAFAQTAAPDARLYQTTTYLRLASGIFDTLPAQTYDFAILDPKSFRPILDPLTGEARIDHAQSYMFDNRTPFKKIVVAGSNYAITEDNFMIAFSSLMDKPILIPGKIDFEVADASGVYFVKKGTREIVTVSSTGAVNRSTGQIAPAIRLKGGNFFVDADNNLWTVNYLGVINKLNNYKVPLAQLAGGNFFYQSDGKIVTIGSDGFPPKDANGLWSTGFMPTAKPKTFGGNYYIGDDNVIYTVSYDGKSYKNGSVPAGKIRTLGYTYAVMDNGSFFHVDGLGVVHLDAVKVSPTKTSYVKISKMSEAIDPSSVYTPNSRR
ncbi:MAG: hypothetical protein JST80_04405 [Bdellovibrionales bacterium]|nr:hypothetical protein [Bdellovibrionales bacterium]